ncbi:sialoadhesin [Oreochromis niloticus]|uniref:sialoadhesin n=1 Tax=Oreochromis niloticus TaxID=8128 RepID=UPI000674A551|nr:sialoadhesin [Oreochromis niloticus]
MEVRDLCFRLLMTVIILLCTHDQKVDAVSLRIVSNKSQFFEYESVSFYCEEPSHGHVLYKMKEEVEQCNKTSKKTAATTTGSKCTIRPIYARDSGEYWCGTAGGQRSNIIYITVSAGSVILEIPAVPVMEGEAVTLSCRNKMLSSSFAADFYKYGRHIRSSSKGNMTIHRVSKFDEGLYKCKISGGGESPESWMTVSLPCLTGSGEGGGKREMVDQSKLRAFYTITAITCAVWLWVVGFLISNALKDSLLLSSTGKCSMLMYMAWFNLPNCLSLDSPGTYARIMFVDFSSAPLRQEASVHSEQNLLP